MPFKRPSQTTKSESNENGVSWPDIKDKLADENALVQFTVNRIQDEVQTKFGVRENVPNVDYTVLSGEHEGEGEVDSLMFAAGVASSLRGASDGDTVLGRIEWKSGKFGKFVALEDATDDDYAQAEKAATAGSASDKAPF